MRSMILIIIGLVVAIIIVRGINLYKKNPLNYEQLLRKGLVLEVLQLKKQAIMSYEIGLTTLKLTLEESSNVHYLIGIINQKEHNSLEAVSHFEEAFKITPEYLQYQKDYQKVIDAYEEAKDEDGLSRITKLFKKQRKIDGRFAKLKYAREEQ